VFWFKSNGSTRAARRMVIICRGSFQTAEKYLTDRYKPRILKSNKHKENAHKYSKE